MLDTIAYIFEYYQKQRTRKEQLNCSHKYKKFLAVVNKHNTTISY